MSKPIKHLVLDFDGTCTKVEDIADKFIKKFKDNFDKVNWAVTSSPDKKNLGEWELALEEMRAASPEAAWTIESTPSAPAAADPYILAGETLKTIYLKKELKPLPDDFFSSAYSSSEALWRDGIQPRLDALIKKGVSIHFISNSSTSKIEGRVRDLYQIKDGTMPPGIQVFGNAAKYRICELSWWLDHSEKAKAKFQSLPAVKKNALLKRPLYLRRGFYFESIMKALGGDPEKLDETLFCGDIWELDLAMPAALNARVHLIERGKGYDTYDYERAAAKEYGDNARISADLGGLMDWFK